MNDSIHKPPSNVWSQLAAATPHSTHYRPNLNQLRSIQQNYNDLFSTSTSIQPVHLDEPLLPNYHTSNNNDLVQSFNKVQIDNTIQSQLQLHALTSVHPRHWSNEFIHQQQPYRSLTPLQFNTDEFIHQQHYTPTTLPQYKQQYDHTPTQLPTIHSSIPYRSANHELLHGIHIPMYLPQSRSHNSLKPNYYNRQQYSTHSNAVTTIDPAIFDTTYERQISNERQELERLSRQYELLQLTQPLPPPQQVEYDQLKQLINKPTHRIDDSHVYANMPHRHSKQIETQHTDTTDDIINTAIHQHNDSTQTADKQSGNSSEADRMDDNEYYGNTHVLTTSAPSQSKSKYQPTHDDTNIDDSEFTDWNQQWSSNNYISHHNQHNSSESIDATDELLFHQDGDHPASININNMDNMQYTDEQYQQHKQMNDIEDAMAVFQHYNTLYSNDSMHPASMSVRHNASIVNHIQSTDDTVWSSTDDKSALYNMIDRWNTNKIHSRPHNHIQPQPHNNNNHTNTVKSSTQLNLGDLTAHVTPGEWDGISSAAYRAIESLTQPLQHDMSYEQMYL